MKRVRSRGRERETDQKTRSFRLDAFSHSRGTCVSQTRQKATLATFERETSDEEIGYEEPEVIYENLLAFLVRTHRSAFPDPNTAGAYSHIDPSANTLHRQYVERERGLTFVLIELYSTSETPRA